MGLLATLAAHDLGFIGRDELVARIDATLTTIEGLERFEGHLLNWYDTQTLAPLPPRYVSTVDSGNLAGALMTLAAGLRQAGPRRSSAGAPPRSPTAMNFRFLYDPQRQLFSIGYRLADAEGPGRLDAVVLRPARLRGAPRQLHRHRARATCPRRTGSTWAGSVTSVDGTPTLLSWSGNAVRVPDAAAS